MPRPCTICSHAKRAAIDRALVLRRPYREISERYGPSKTALYRHLTEHVAPKIAQLREQGDERAALDVLGEVQKLFERMGRQLAAAEEGGDWRPVVAFASEARKDLELAGRLLGTVEPPTVNVVIDVRVQAVILDALAPYPEARLAVADALRELAPENGHAGDGG